MSPHRYLGVTLGTTIGVALAILLFNWLVDPFALRTAGSEPPAAEAGTAPAAPFWHKAFAVRRVMPAGLILGTSRADAGLDATHTGFPRETQPVYNLALAASSISQMRDLLVHAHNARGLRLVVIGLDLESFLPGERTDFDAAVLAGNTESAPEWANRLRFHLSWRALEASAGRLLPERPAGPARELIVGARVAFQVAEFQNFYSRLPQLFPRWTPESSWGSDRRRAASLEAFRELVAYAHEQSIDLRLFISPVHARYLELYRRIGWWPMFEAWKRELLTILAEESRGRGPAGAFQLWDFSGFHGAALEALPTASDLHTRPRWYYDSSHYSREHGDRILDRILDRAGADAHSTIVPAALLRPETLEAHLGRLRRDADDYRAAHPAEVEELGATVRLLRRFARR